MATKSGSLVDDIKSPYSSPYVHYSCSYTTERASTTTAGISVTLNFKGWLNSNSSYLGAGIILIIYARLNGGAWQSVTIKSGSTTWGANNTGTTKHSAPALTLTGASTADKINVEFYVARGDSGGNSGKLGTKSSPKVYAAKLPAYSAVTPEPEPEPTPTVSYYVRIKASGVWQKATPYVKVNGTWKKTTPYIKVSGVWKKGVS